MSNQISTSTTFQEKMFERIREQMGDLLTDDDLKVLVEKAVNDAFFKPVVVNPGTYHERKEPPYFVQLVKDLLRNEVSNQLAQFIKDNPEIVNNSIQEALGGGVTKLLVQYFDSRWSGPLHELSSKLQQKGIL